jgi:phage terminase large subunit
MNSLADSSMEEIKAAIRSIDWLAPAFEIGENYIRTKDGRVSYSFIGLSRNVDSIKSKARIILCWVDEAEPVTETSWQKLIPTVREQDSEIWVTWNPERKTSPTHKRFRIHASDDMKIIEMNWRDNPWFPAVLETERERDFRERPDSYPHIWEGDFIKAQEGAYYASALATARSEGRIGKVAQDPLMQLRAYWDIGGTGKTADATAIWIAQFVGREVRVLNYYEAVGQELSAHVNWLRANGYGGARCILPHDGAHRDNYTAVRFEDHLRSAGFSVPPPIKNQGKAAGMQRIEAARRWFPRMWFDATKCEAGLRALAAYHPRIDPVRRIDLGPEHDWASHCADAFGLMATAYREPTSTSFQAPDRRKQLAGYV